MFTVSVWAHIKRQTAEQLSAEDSRLSESWRQADTHTPHTHMHATKVKSLANHAKLPFSISHPSWLLYSLDQPLSSHIILTKPLNDSLRSSYELIKRFFRPSLVQQRRRTGSMSVELQKTLLSSCEKASCLLILVLNHMLQYFSAPWIRLGAHTDSHSPVVNLVWVSSCYAAAGDRSD